MVKATAVAEKGLRPAPPEGGRALGLQRTGSYESEAFYTHRLSLLSRLIARETRQMLAEPFGLSQMDWRVRITVASFLLTVLSTLYPAWRAARTQPAEALRYE